MARIDAVIVAAGTSERFTGSEPKQFLLLQGKPILIRAVESLADCSAVESITVACTPGDEARVEKLLATHDIGKVRHVVPGGRTRQESVALGLKTLSADSHDVVVHDAARPCVSSALVEAIVAALAAHAAVVPVVPVVDTLVLAAAQQIDAIVDRVNVARAQTPQAFRTDLLRRAHRSAEARGFVCSDDGSLVFALKEPVHIIPGDPDNIKITVPSDLRIAEAILTQRSAQR